MVYYVKQNPDFVTWMAKTKNAKASEDLQSWMEDLQSGVTAQQADGAKYLAQ